MRESGLAFFSSLTLHSLAMGFVVGVNIVVALRLIGFAPRLDISALVRFYTLHWYCVGLIFISGLALLLAYPAKALSNPVFYLKLCVLTGALLLSRHFQKTYAAPQDTSVEGSSRRLAYLSLLLWAIVLSAGRFLAYTYTTLLASRFY